MTAKIPVICLGAGGHAGVIADCFFSNENYYLVGLLDNDQACHGLNRFGLEIFGGDDHLQALRKEGVRHFVVGVGSIKSGSQRSAIFDRAINSGFSPVTCVHPSAIISRTAQIGAGTVVLPGAVINNNAKIGRNVIINTGVVVEHDAYIGDHSHLATTCCLAGNVTIGMNVMIGANATIINGISIASDVTVGAGAVVVNHVTIPQVVVGVPARELI